MRIIQRVCLWSVAVLVASLTVAPVAAGPAVPKLTCDEPKFVFGEMSNDRDVIHPFVIRNVGEAPLLIRNVRTSCGCTTTEITSKEIPAGGESRITAKFSLRGRSGPQEKNIYIESNDPQTPTFSLQLAGTATIEIAAQPAYVDFGRLKKGVRAEREVRIVGRTNVTFHVVRLESPAGGFTGSVQTNTDGREYVLKVTTEGQAEPGVRQSTFIVVTDDPRFASIPVVVSASTPSDLVAVPSAIMLAASGSTQALSRVLTVYSPEAREFNLTAVEPPLAEIQTKTQKIGPGKYRIDVTGLIPDPRLTGKAIRVKTDLPEAPELSSPVRVLGTAP